MRRTGVLVAAGTGLVGAGLLLLVLLAGWAGVVACALQGS